MNRYRSRKIFHNMPSMYGKMMHERGRGLSNQFHETPRFDFPSPGELEEITHVRHVWKVGDRFYKLAHEHYGDATAWWIIALYNGAPTEGHLRTGMEIYIPHPPGRLMMYYGL